MGEKESENVEIQAGKALIAEPFLSDANFGRSVILLCENSEEGSFGLILNQPTTNVLSDLIDTIFIDFPVYKGGPVEQNTLHFIHRLGKTIPDSLDLGNNIFWSGDFETIIEKINTGLIDEKDIKFFIGYSGWGAGQLAEELKQNSWIVADVEEELIFDLDPEKSWQFILKNMGGKFKQMANYPIDPRLN